MPKKILKNIAIQKIVQATQNIDIQTINSQEWHEILNEQNYSHIKFVQTFIKNIAEKGLQATSLPGFISLISPIGLREIQTYQEDFIRRLTEIRVKNYILQNPEQFSTYLAGKTLAERAVRIEEFEFWRKMNAALSQTGEKRLILIAKVLEDTPNSLEYDFTDIKNNIVSQLQIEEKLKDKEKELLKANTEQIIRKIIEYRDEKAQEFQQLLQEIKEEIRPFDINKIRYLNNYIDEYVKLKEQAGYEKRMKLLKLDKKMNDFLRLFEKDPFKFVDPLNQFSVKDQHIKILQTYRKFEEYQKEVLNDNEEIAIGKIKQNIKELEKKIKKLVAKNIIDRNNPELEKNLNEANALLKNEYEKIKYLEIQKKVRENPVLYFQTYNELGQQTILSINTSTLPITIKQADIEMYKRALNEFASIDESGKFIEVDFKKSTIYRNPFEFSENLLETVEFIKKEYPAEAEAILNPQSNHHTPASTPTPDRPPTPFRLTAIPRLTIPQRVSNTKQVQQDLTQVNPKPIEDNQTTKNTSNPDLQKTRGK